MSQKKVIFTCMDFKQLKMAKKDFDQSIASLTINYPLIIINNYVISLVSLFTKYIS
jgi:hypothetical protein